MLVCGLLGLARSAMAQRVVPTVVQRAEPADARRQLTSSGELGVVARDVDRPTRTLDQVSVLLDPLNGSSKSRIVLPLDSGLVAHSKSTSAGEYLLRAHRIGYYDIIVPVTVLAGCRTDVEVYLPVRANCLGSCPVTTLER